jgi:hypothetical protein
MEAFGYYRVAGLLHKNNLPTEKVGATELTQWLFLFWKCANQPTLRLRQASVPVGVISGMADCVGMIRKRISKYVPMCNYANEAC